MTRIKLKDEDIEIFEWEESSDPDRYELNFMCNSLQEAEQLKKQILEDYEFRERFNFEKVMELKHKAEENDVKAVLNPLEPNGDVEIGREG